jgi:hypothetical protein
MDDQQSTRAGYCSGFAQQPQQPAEKSCAANDAREAAIAERL